MNTGRPNVKANKDGSGYMIGGTMMVLGVTGIILPVPTIVGAALLSVGTIIVANQLITEKKGAVQRFKNKVGFQTQSSSTNHDGIHYPTLKNALEKHKNNVLIVINQWLDGIYQAYMNVAKGR